MLKIKDNFPFFTLDKDIVGEKYTSKINKISKYLKKNKSDYLLLIMDRSRFFYYVLVLDQFAASKKGSSNC